jgi:hypothetical protein
MKQTVNQTAATMPVAQAKEAEPSILRKRIGSTTYVVNVRFSEKATETLEDKILRLIEREVRHAS